MYKLPIDIMYFTEISEYLFEANTLLRSSSLPDNPIRPLLFHQDPVEGSPSAKS